MFDLSLIISIKIMFNVVSYLNNDSIVFNIKICFIYNLNLIYAFTTYSLYKINYLNKREKIIIIYKI